MNKFSYKWDPVQRNLVNKYNFSSLAVFYVFLNFDVSFDVMIIALDRNEANENELIISIPTQLRLEINLMVRTLLFSFANRVSLHNIFVTS